MCGELFPEVRSFMAKKRTKKQKQTARKRRGLSQPRSELKVLSESGQSSDPIPAKPSYSWSGSSQAKKSKKPALDDDFFGYSPKLIFSDLKKTLVVTVIVVAALLAILIYT